jgi:predicted lipoprotein with Yx(FWY)xxD motif
MTATNSDTDGPRFRRGPSRGSGRARSAAAIGAVAVVAVIAAACSSSPAPLGAPKSNSPAITPSATTSTPSASATTAPAASATTVDVVSNSSFGKILETPRGLALYTFSGDHNGISTCTGSCAQAWPALTVSAGTTPTAGSALNGTLAAVKQSNGTYQVTYNGAPLYTFASDTTGQVTGNGVSGFSVAKVSGSSNSSAATTTTSGGGNGY